MLAVSGFLDIVRVKPGVTPSTGWGSASPSSEGPVRSIRGERAYVDFPQQSGWVGILGEMEVVRRGAAVTGKAADDAYTNRTVQLAKNTKTL